MLNKKIIKKEIIIPLIIIGVLILLPIFYSLFKVEASEEKYSEKKLIRTK